MTLDPKLEEMIDNVLSDSRLSEIISAETYFKNDVGMEIANTFSDHARELLAKYVIARAFSMRYLKKGNDSDREMSLSDFIQYGIDYLVGTEYSGKVTKHKTRMQAISERIEMVSLSDSLFVRDPGLLEKKWYNITPVLATYQFLLLYLISEAPYVRISVSECLEKRKADKIEELKQLKGNFLQLDFDPEIRIDGDLDVSDYVKTKRTIHIKGLKTVLKEVEEIKLSIIPFKFPHAKTKIPKKIADYAKSVYELWDDLEKFLNEELDLAKDNKEAENLYKKENCREYLGKWEQLNKRRVAQVRSCLYEKENVKSIVEILTYNKNDLSTSGDLNGDLICKFLMDCNHLLSIIKNDLLSREGDEASESDKNAKSQKESNAEFFADLQKENFFLSYYFMDQMYPIDVTAFIINEFKEFSDLGKRAKEEILDALSKIILIPDVFSRELYLQILLRVYRKYTSANNGKYHVREEIRPTLYLMNIVEEFDLDLWIDDISEYLQHLAFNFYPVLDAICDEVFANEYEITTDELAAAFRDIAETHDVWESEKLQSNLKMIHDNEDLSVKILRNYYDILYAKEAFANKDILLKNIIQLYDDKNVNGLSSYVQDVSKKAVRKYLRELGNLKSLDKEL